jgi:molybdopterin/thiamine biosynthesis adenylyltransferase
LKAYGAGEALRLEIFGRIFLAISISYGHLQNFALDVLLDVSLDTRSPLNLARVPLKTNSVSMEIREVLLATSVSAKRRFRLTRYSRLRPVIHPRDHEEESAGGNDKCCRCRWPRSSPSDSEPGCACFATTARPSIEAVGKERQAALLKNLKEGECGRYGVGGVCGVAQP